MVEGEPPKPKRSLFTKSAFAPDSKTASPAGDIFHRSEQAYADIRAEQAAKYRLKQQKKEEAAKREAEAKNRESKRRRISQEEDEKLEDQVYKNSGSKIVNLDTSPRKGKKPPADCKPTALISSPESDTKHHEAQTTKHEAKTGPRIAETIQLDDDDDDIMIVETKKRESDTIDDGFSDDAESDPDIRELKRSIRERTRLRETNASASISVTDTVSKASSATQPIKPSTSSEPVFDPPISILITSSLPNARPLVVKRRWTQRLQEIREKYCEFNNLPQNGIFFTWRNRKLFDVTTCRSLGIKVDDEGLPILRSNMDGLTDDGSKIHIEAVNEEIFTENKRLAEQKYKSLYEPTAEEADPPIDEPPREEKQQLRLLLKAREFDPWKAKVNLDHNFARIATAFRKQFRVADDKVVFLVYDGDRLDPNGLVKDIDFEDQDTVEVHIK